MEKVQSKLIRLEKLLLVNPYRIVSLWSNGEIRINDFSKEVTEWRTGKVKELKKLANTKVFKSAFVKDGTLAFALSTVQIPGIPGDQPIDFDRRKLYNDSQLIGHAVTYSDAIHHQKSRLNRRKRSIELPKGVKVRSQPDDFSYDLEPINKISQKIGSPVTHLIVIGDELVELNT